MRSRSLDDLRVAHIVPAPFDPEDGIIGGAERYSFELARHMAERVPTRLISFGDRERTARVATSVARQTPPAARPTKRTAPARGAPPTGRKARRTIRG